MNSILDRMKADAQIGGTHYEKYTCQPFEAMMERMTHDQAVGALWFNSSKYLMRWQDKGGVEDLHKCQWYLTKLINIMEEDHAST